MESLEFVFYSKTVLGYALPKELGVSLILNALNKRYDQFVQNYNMYSLGKTLAKLHAMLKLHEKGIPKKVETPTMLAIWEGKIQKDKKKLQRAKGEGKGKNKFAYAPKPKIPPPPKTVSKEGANYFITFTDDFSRYGFVYLMKHKHDVFETFKVFLNEVENQLASGSHGLLEMSASDKGLEIIQEEDTQPSKNTSEAHNDVAPIKEYEFGDLDERPNYKAALAYPESNKCLEAMNTEMQSMKDNQLWYLVDLPSNGKPVGCKWIFKKKTDMNGNVHTFKGHLVAQGFTQSYGVDYGETFYPVADIRAIGILLAIVVFYNYEI
uniref:Putative retrotransposon Ty1-copia subclass protein n=1 Tax=Tanacetum cinerariifolium TaxID=118510 RepID=A0A6L2J0R9_TANCI|nr:putative retrotransposon Ty1-copia subclass protein [Tanacetum cinerariifolium]